MTLWCIYNVLHENKASITQILWFIQTDIFNKYMSHLMTKATKWLCAQRRLRSAWAFAQADQSSLSTWRNIGSSATHWVHCEDFDQTGQMPRLIWVFAGCTVISLLLSWGGSVMKTKGFKKLSLTVKKYEPCHEKIYIRCFLPGNTQAGLLSYRD